MDTDHQTTPGGQSLPAILQSPTPAPLFFADHAIQLSVGLSVTKITLALEVGPGQVMPSAVVVLPTPSALQLGKTLIAELSREENNDKIKKLFEEYQVKITG